MPGHENIYQKIMITWLGHREVLKNGRDRVTDEEILKLEEPRNYNDLKTTNTAHKIVDVPIHNSKNNKVSKQPPLHTIYEGKVKHGHIRKVLGPDKMWGQTWSW